MNVGPSDAGRLDANEHLVRLGAGRRYLFDGDYIRFAKDDCLHGVHSL